MNVTIVDGYIDEPASLGVPPFISPAVRYIIGAVLSAEEGVTVADINYLTIDDVRRDNNPGNFPPSQADLLLIVSNLQVPGKYRGGTPASKRELEEIARQCEGEVFSWALPLSGATHISADPDLVLHEHIRGGGAPGARRSRKTPVMWEQFAMAGARGVPLVLSSSSYSPDYSICEIDSFKGCPRKPGCTFCPEWQRPLFSRAPEDVKNEIRELMRQGVTKFRIGGSCFFSYLSSELGRKDVPEPNVEELTVLLKELSALGPEVLHIDNANPAVIAAYPDESSLLCEAIVSHGTPGNLASFGMESADPEVIRKNNINSSPGDVFQAITILNRFGKKRGENGLPAFLPGINLLYGLPGETPETFRYNYEFLKRVYKEGLLLRRINIRQVDYGFMNGCGPNEGPERDSRKLRKRHRSAFVNYKARIRENIDRPMLARLIPEGTVLRRVYIENIEGKVSFGRQLGTYPVLVGVPYHLGTGSFHDIKVSSHGFRSITGMGHPFHINEASFSQLEALPGIGKKRAARIFKGLPVHEEEHFVGLLDDETIARRLLRENWIDLA